MQPLVTQDSPAMFSSVDMESTLLVSNAGILITTYGIILFLIVMTFFMLRCLDASRSPKCSMCLFKVKSCLSLNFILRLLIETYLDIGLCSLLNISYVSNLLISSSTYRLPSMFGQAVSLCSSEFCTCCCLFWLWE